jgi:uncharacterized lipoprotein YmbA
MKRLLLISLLWLVGCAGPRQQTITVTLTPPPTLAHPHAWLTLEACIPVMSPESSVRCQVHAKTDDTIGQTGCSRL